MSNAYVTITSGLRGYFAVLVVDDEPWETGLGSYKTAEDAVPEAKSWAEAEEIPYREPKAIELNPETKEFRVLVCGGRRYQNRKAVFAYLDVKHAHRPITLIIHGGARGADTLAKEWAIFNGVDFVEYPYPKGRGTAGGKERNVIMYDTEQPHLVVAFVGGGGTCHMYDYAKSQGCEVVWVEE